MQKLPTVPVASYFTMHPNQQIVTHFQTPWGMVPRNNGVDTTGGRGFARMQVHHTLPVFLKLPKS